MISNKCFLFFGMWARGEWCDATLSGQGFMTPAETTNACIAWHLSFLKRGWGFSTCFVKIIWTTLQDLIKYLRFIHLQLIRPFAHRTNRKKTKYLSFNSKAYHLKKTLSTTANIKANEKHNLIPAFANKHLAKPSPSSASWPDAWLAPFKTKPK